MKLFMSRIVFHFKYFNKLIYCKASRPSDVIARAFQVVNSTL